MTNITPYPICWNRRYGKYDFGYDLNQLEDQNHQCQSHLRRLSCLKPGEISIY